ncbi:hypothetical protein EDD18DRAFT_1356223 [Armillaria luteobubalina]|uniref:Uncharacterized protein n=1 Tax=Armillaria luteobubalina TaxID=153913 RepID=A0AA39Q172_9AGAR|nr:hypothetical protein EDD18DRAFT_1356223 [Armillaria luteobubalina]
MTLKANNTFVVPLLYFIYMSSLDALGTTQVVTLGTLFNTLPRKSSHTSLEQPKLADSLALLPYCLRYLHPTKPAPEWNRVLLSVLS